MSARLFTPTRRAEATQREVPVICCTSPLKPHTNFQLMSPHERTHIHTHSDINA